MYLNVSLLGLTGRPHPAWVYIGYANEVKKARIHLKMLAGDYYTYEIKSYQSGGSPNCRSCDPIVAIETIEHILAVCEAYALIRQRIFPEIEALRNNGRYRSRNITIYLSKLQV